MSTNKSTNVRSMIEAAARATTQALQIVSPSTAAQLATWLFVRGPKRHGETGRRPLATPVRIGLPVRGRTLVAWSWGDETKPAAILVHGWGGRASQLLGFVDPLLAADLRVIAFDAPGHGESPGDTTNIPEIADAVHAAAALASSVKAVIGHSMGGAAVAYALAHGLDLNAEGRAAILGAPADAMQWLDELAHALDLRAGVRAETQRRIEAAVGVPFQALDAAALAPSIRVPFLVAHDRGDRNVPFPDAERWVALIRRAELHATEGLGHQRILRDATVIARVVSFVTGTKLLARIPARSEHLDAAADRIAAALDAA